MGRKFEQKRKAKWLKKKTNLVKAYTQSHCTTIIGWQAHGQDSSRCYLVVMVTSELSWSVGPGAEKERPTTGTPLV